MTYYAKSKLSDGSQPTVREHLEAVSSLAAQFGKTIGMESEAELAGLYHDFGKYSNAFQDVLQGTRQGVDHAFPGAVLLWKQHKNKRAIAPLVEAVNGHHNGLKSCAMLQPYFNANQAEAVRCNGSKTASLCGKEYQTAWDAFVKDFPNGQPLKKPHLADAKDTEDQFTMNLEGMLYTRLLFSCLVDADYSVSASDENPEYLSASEDNSFDPQEAFVRLNDYRNTLIDNSNAAETVNRIREQLYHQCGEMGKTATGLFTLTAPTGTGKTLALLHFALQHCIASQKKRIIVVLPFLSLTEQTAEIYRRIIPNLLEDHSQSNLDDTQRQFAARWSAPVIITTSVKFFETLFSSTPGDCRKLHNIADSVILFDEAQSLPTDLTVSSLRAVNLLCEKYNTSMVFSTATQPAFEAIPNLSWNPTEIMPENAKMYSSLKRTRVLWQIKKPIPLSEIAQKMAAQENVCTIVNLRRHATKLFEELTLHDNPESCFLLTTDLCAAHRSKVIAEIRHRQKEGLPCRVVATQCIEAGVDLDFHELFRALAPLESIIQAAGRCNRNGTLTNGGVVTVFEPEEKGRLYPGDWYEKAALTVKFIASDHPIDINDPREINNYYCHIFKEHKEKQALVEAICDKDYATVEQEYRLIEDRGVQVIVPYAGEIALYQSVRDEAIRKGVSPSLLKRSAGITVSVPFGKQAEKLEQYAERLPYSRGARPQEEGMNYSNVFLLPPNSSFYRQKEGLQLPANAQQDCLW